MAKTKKKETIKQGLRPAQIAKAEKLRKKQEAKAKKTVSSMQDKETVEFAEMKKTSATKANVSIEQSKTIAKDSVKKTDERHDKSVLNETVSEKPTQQGKNKKISADSKLQSPQIVHVKNAEGDPDTVAEIIIQNKIDYIPKVSVVMPVYNVEAYLPQCLDSVVNQTLKEIEIICVDDGSTDSSLDILKEYAAKDNRITVMTQENAGSGKARNNALDNSKGEFIAFMDSDDLYPNNKTLEHMYKAAVGNNVLICGGSLSQIREGGKIVTDPKKFEEGYSFSKDGIIKYDEYQFDFGYWRFIYNRQFLKEHQLYFPDYLRCQDPPFFVKVMCIAESFYALKEPTYVYRVSYKQISWNERKVTDVYKARMNLLDLCKTYQLEELYRRIAKYISSEYLLKQIDDLIENNENVRFYIKQALEAIDTDKIVDSKTLKTRYNTLQRLQEKTDPYKPTTGVSIIIPCYNVEPYLRQCLDSVINQTMKNIQIICINDESPDNSLEILKEYAAKDNRIVIIDQKNQGLSGSRNNALKIITGEYVQFLDSDDWLELNAVETLYNKAKKYDLDVLNFEGWNYFPESNQYQQSKGQKVDYIPFDKPYYDKEDIEKFANIIPVSSCRFFYKASFIKEHNYTFPVGLCFEDNLFTRRAFCEMSRFGVEKSIFYNRRMHEGQITANFDKLFNDYLKVVLRISKYYVERGFENKPSIQSVILTYCDQIIKRFSEFSIENQARYIGSLLRFFNDLSQNFTLSVNAKKFIRECDPVYLYRKMWENWCERLQKNFNIDNPKTLNEKIQWMKIYDSTPIKTRLADKYLVREWIKEKIGEEYLIPLIGVYDNFKEIDFDNLPDQFVIKCNHGSGYNIVVENKSDLDLKDVKEKLNLWMNEDFAFKSGYELHYRDIPHKITIEKYLENSKGNLRDYKFLCCNGKIELILVDSERFSEHRRNIYDPDWNMQNFSNYPNIKENIEKPKNFDKLKEIVTKLASGFNFVRVDFYIVQDKAYFGEMTFTPSSGAYNFPDEIQLKLGNLVKLPKIAYDVDTKKYYELKKQNKIVTYLAYPYYALRIRQLKQKYVHAYSLKLKKKLTSLRIDAKNYGSNQNSLEVIANDMSIIEPRWFSDSQGKGKMLQNNAMKDIIKIKIINDGLLKFNFRGQEKKYNGKKLPVWIDYKSIKIDGNEILTEAVATWHDKPYHYEMSVKDGQEITMEVEQQYHEYSEEELKDLTIKLDANTEYVNENIDVLMGKLKKYFPIINMQKYKKQQVESCVAEILPSLISYRLDIKNFGTDGNALNIIADNASITEPKWYTDIHGKGQVLQGNAMNNTIKIKAINDGILKLDFRGQDKRYEGERFPVWIDYKSIKIDGKEILTESIATWHDKPYRYEMPVKDGQEITMEIEQQYHQYTKDEIRDIIGKLNIVSKDQLTDELVDIVYQRITPVVEEKVA